LIRGNIFIEPGFCPNGIHKLFRNEVCLAVALRIGFSIKCETKTLLKHALFSQGRVAEIIVNKKTVGYIGELDSKVLENFKIRTRVVGFEIKLNGLIFD